MANWIYNNTPWWVLMAIGIFFLSFVIPLYQDAVDEANQAKAALAQPAPDPISLNDFVARANAKDPLEAAVSVALGDAMWELTKSRKGPNAHGFMVPLFHDAASFEQKAAGAMLIVAEEAKLDAWLAIAEPDPKVPGNLILRGLIPSDTSLFEVGSDALREDGFTLANDDLGITPFAGSREDALKERSEVEYLLPAIPAVFGLVLLGAGYFRRKSKLAEEIII